MKLDYFLLRLSSNINIKMGIINSTDDYNENIKEVKSFDNVITSSSDSKSENNIIEEGYEECNIMEEGYEECNKSNKMGVLIKYTIDNYRRNIPIIFKCKIHDPQYKIVKLNSNYETNIKDIICDVNSYIQADYSIVYGNYIYYAYNNLEDTMNKDMQYLLTYISSVFTKSMSKYYKCEYSITVSSYKLDRRINSDGLKNYVKKIAIHNNWDNILRILMYSGKVNKTFMKNYEIDKSISDFWYKGHTISKSRMKEKYIENRSDILKPACKNNYVENNYIENNYVENNYTETLNDEIINLNYSEKYSDDVEKVRTNNKRRMKDKKNKKVDNSNDLDESTFNIIEDYGN